MTDCPEEISNYQANQSIRRSIQVAQTCKKKTWDPSVKTAVLCVHRGVLVSRTLSIMSWYLTWDLLPFVASNPLSCHLYTMKKSERLIKPSRKDTEQGLLLGSTWPNRCSKSTCPLCKIHMPSVQNPWKPSRYGSWKPFLFLAKFRQKEKLNIRNSKLNFSRQKWGKHLLKIAIFLYLLFSDVAIYIQGWLNICALYLVYSQIWLNHRTEDCHFFFIFLWMIAFWATIK